MERARAQNYIRESNRPLPAQVDMGEITGNPKLRGVRVDAQTALPYLMGTVAKGQGAGVSNGTDMFAGLSPVDRKTMSQIASAAQQVNETANAYKTKGLDSMGSAGANVMNHMLPSVLSGPIMGRMAPDTNEFAQQNELLTDQMVPLVTGNPRASSEVRAAIRKNVMVEPGTPQDVAMKKYANMYRDMRDRLQSQGRLTQPVANMLDEIIQAQGAGNMDQVMAKYHGITANNPGMATTQDVSNASQGGPAPAPQKRYKILSVQ
jgi:hypothetical protein